MTLDPIKDGLNWYAYCAGNPVMFVDPWGLYEPGDEKYKESNPIVYAALDDLTKSWNNLNELINSGTLTESEIETAQSNQRAIGELADIVRIIGNYMVVSDTKLIDSKYGNLNNTEKVIYSGGYGLGSIVGLAGYNAGLDTLDYFGYDDDGTIQNAYKHALWNAYAVSYGVGEIYVKNFTNAHEFGNPNNFKTSDSYEATRMDLHNNEVGRGWGKEYNIFTAPDMVNYMWDEQRMNELQIIKTN